VPLSCGVSVGGCAAGGRVAELWLVPRTPMATTVQIPVRRNAGERLDMESPLVGSLIDCADGFESISGKLVIPLLR
jgi:hypothetical protein